MGGLCFKTRKSKIKIKNDNEDMMNANLQIFEANIQGKKKKDLAGQDASDILIDLGENIKYFAVYDGHGTKGKDASLLLRYEVSKKLVRDKSTIQKFVRKDQVEKYFTKLFKSIQKKYHRSSNDYEMSGTTAVCILIIEQKLYCINLGDSRAVLGSEKKDKKVATEMSIDHKPSRDDEMKRIIEKGGEVNDKTGVPRVFKKNEDQPGLAVSRTIGDIMAHECGVSSEPEVIEKELDSDDKFIVIGSDGIWDVMSSPEVVGFIFDKMELEKKELASKLLVEECRNRWDIVNLFKQKYFYELQQNKETDTKSKEAQYSEVDDITAIIHFLNID